MRSKKLLLLSSLGGYGHVAAAKTLTAILGKEYEIEIVYPIKELRICGIPSVEESFYNFLLSHNFNQTINWVVRNIAGHIFVQREEKTSKLIQKYIEEKCPDILISLIPFVNYPASEAARKCGIPILLITTDNDLENWIFSLRKNRHTNLKVTIGSDLKTTKKKLIDNKISPAAIETIGLPLRPAFLKGKTKEELRKEYRIPQNKNVILIMLGGIGASSTFQYVKSIAQSSLNVHVMVCAGKNRKLAKKLLTIPSKIGNSIDVIPFTEKVHELFMIADLLITKPGPGTINEAFYMKLPVLIDQTTIPLFWEQANIDLVLDHQVGECIPSFESLPALIGKFLHDEETKNSVREAYEKIPRNQFATRIEQLIQEMCGETILEEMQLASQEALIP